MAGKEGFANAGGIVKHLFGVRIGQGKRLFAGDVAAVFKRKHRHGLMPHVRGTDGDKIGLFFEDHLLGIGIPMRNAVPFCGSFGGDGVHIADGDEIHQLGDGKIGGDMRGIGNHASADDDNLEFTLVHSRYPFWKRL
ncbi:hypothetical protein SDC9_132083 [bioreactor metagenome]|uniref:Uncharacterized protein n=1 Tax=bioreactor metagenome TaxID=1076179 RepID=A0A645D6K6_9ZZZZ